MSQNVDGGRSGGAAPWPGTVRDWEYADGPRFTIRCGGCRLNFMAGPRRRVCRKCAGIVDRCGGFVASSIFEAEAFIRERAGWWRRRADFAESDGELRENVNLWLGRAAHAEALADRLAALASSRNAPSIAAPPDPQQPEI